MAIKFIDTLEFANPNYPLVDSNFIKGGFRTGVANLTALYALYSKRFQLKEHSTIVYVSGETKYYILKDYVNIGNANGWEVFGGGGGGGTVSGATNGLTLSNGVIKLGGDLSGNTSINGTTFGFTANTKNITLQAINGINIIDTDGIGGINIESDGGTIALIGNNSVGVEKTKLEVSDTNLLITDSRTTQVGLQYANNYCSSFTARSIPDVAYVTGYTQSISNVDTVCQVISTYTTVPTDNFVGVCSLSATICLQDTPTPKYGQKVTVADVCGNALTYPIVVCGGTNLINGGSTATIGTNYGSISFIYNCNNFWSAIAFIN